MLPSDLFGAVTAIALLLLGFVFVLVVAYLTVRLAGRQFMGNAAAGYIKVLDRVPLAPDRMLCIVRAADKTLLLGVTQHNIETLCEIDEERLVATPPQTPGGPFADVLTSAIRSLGRKGPRASDKEDSQDGA